MTPRASEMVPGRVYKLGVATQTDLPARAPAGAVRLPVCPYLGDPIAGDAVTVDVTCPSCGGGLTTSRITNPVHACERFGRCLPTYQCAKTALAEVTIAGDDTAAACLKCELHPLNIFKLLHARQPISPEQQTVADLARLDVANVLTELKGKNHG